MKYILLQIIHLYQVIVSPILLQFVGQSRACRYEKSCSEYAKEQIEKKGIVSGSALAMKRIASCQPFTKPNNKYV